MGQGIRDIGRSQDVGIFAVQVQSALRQRRGARTGSLIVRPDTRGPEPTDFLEMKRGMPGVGLEKREGLVSELLDFGGKVPVAGPKGGRGS